MRTPKFLTAAMMTTRAYSDRTPAGILPLANHAWTTSQHDPSASGDRWYGDNYLEACPSMWAEQRLGLGVVIHLADHIRRAHWSTHPNTGSPASAGSVGHSWREQHAEAQPLPSLLGFSRAYALSDSTPLHSVTLGAGRVYR